MQKIKWSVIGAGGIADRRTIPGLLLHEGSELVAVMDVNPDTAKALGEKYGVPAFTSDEEMLKSVPSDAVYIATPVMCHYEQAMLCLKHDRHVLCEKPVTLKTEEARALVDAFKAAGKHFSVGYMMKHHNLHEKAREMVASGAVGKPADVRAMFSGWYPDIPGAWRQTKAYGGGGAFMDLGVHCLDLIEHVLGDKITEVKSFYNTQTFNYEVEDSAVVIFRTEGGVLGHIDCNFNVTGASAPARLEVYGTLGSIVCTNTLAQEECGTMVYTYAPQADYVAKWTADAERKSEYFDGEMGNIYTKQISSFCDVLLSGVPDYTVADRAVRISALCDRIYADGK